MSEVHQAPASIMKKMHVLANLLVPAGGSLSLTARDIDLDTFINQFWQSSGQNRLGLRAAVLLVWWLGPLWFARTPLPLGRLDAGRQYAALEAMHHSRFYLWRGMLLIVNTVIQMAFYSDERVARSVGYHNFDAGANIVDGYLPQGRES